MRFWLAIGAVALLGGLLVFLVILPPPAVDDAPVEPVPPAPVSTADPAPEPANTSPATPPEAGKSIEKQPAPVTIQKPADGPAPEPLTPQQIADIRAGKISIGGKAEPIADPTTPEVQSIIAGLGGKHPERMTEMITPAPFDPEAYRADPQTYLQTIEPGRIWQSAAPGEDVPPISVVGQAWFEVPQNHPVTLTVRATPAAPVTFHSFDMGAFGNQLTTQTVAADADGLARVQFTATPGTVALANIQAASPLCSGQVRFTIEVVLPELPPVAEAP